MKKIILSILYFAILLSCASAQKKVRQSSKYKFVSTVNYGILEGSADKTYGQMQFVNGIKKETWFTGIGAGVDYYGSKRSVTCFVRWCWATKCCLPRHLLRPTPLPAAWLRWWCLAVAPSRWRGC